MFGPQDGYEGFPSRSNSYAEDLMSLNTLNQNDIRNKKPVINSESRSLKTDDIPGAKPRSGQRKQVDEGVYQGLNFPSYNEKNSLNRAKPSLASPDYLANAGNNYGYLPDSKIQSENQYKQPLYNQNPVSDGSQIPSKIAANFYGVTPPQSGIPPDYINQVVGSKALANFYGVTPPQSRSNNPYTDPKENYVPGNYPSAKEIANFYGVTPPQSRSNVYKNQDFSKYPQNIGNYESPGLANYPSQNIGNYDEGLNYPHQNTGNYGNPSIGTYDSQTLGNYAKPNTKTYEIVPKYPRGQEERREPRNLLSKSPVNYQIPAKEIGNFYGVTPPRSSSNNQIPPKEISKFYGVTPPVSRYQQVRTQNLSDNQYPANLSNKNIANFYGATPPSSAPKKDNDFLKNSAKFFGYDGIDPEFQYAADIVNKGPEVYQNPNKANPYEFARNERYQVSTAKRIFN